jgi:hypothetical protein
MPVERVGAARVSLLAFSVGVGLSTEVVDWIEVFSNRIRRHSSIGMQSPISFTNN